MKEDAIFLQALDVGSSVRAAFLDNACGANTQLRADVEQLLCAHRQAGRFLERPADELTDLLAQDRIEQRGMSIGPYRLMEQIGEGGFGVVFLAAQQEPVRRRVALKVLKPGMDTASVIARFNQERQALALMDHPNIARVLDGGTTGSGRPYFVMELIAGVPVTQFCDDKQLSLQQRLELFVTICQAVQHAHQKGIIHRDLKPSNVLVATVDDVPVAKVIDFGVAKATGQQLSDKTALTRIPQMIGTPLYMSPEQVQLQVKEIDTRTDIYSLGILLYELITSATPFDKRRLEDASFDDMRSLVCSEEPPRPSQRLAMLGKSLPEIAARRQLAPAQLRQSVRRDLDWIVMKAIEKSPDRRYATAGEFAADIQRFLTDEPVLARPPSVVYRLSKLVRRHRGPFVGAAAAVLALIAAVVLLAISNAAIREEQQRTQAAHGRAVEAQKTAEHATLVAQQHAEQIRRDVDNLKMANRLVEQGRLLVHERRWDDAEACFSQALSHRPDSASLWSARADLYVRLGLYDLALADFNRAHELQEPQSGLLWRGHALLLTRAGDTAGLGRHVALMRERTHGTANQVLALEGILASALDRSSQSHQSDVALAQQIVASDPQNAWFHYGLGVALYRNSQVEMAAHELETALASPWPAREIAYPVLAMARYRLEQPEQARTALELGDKALARWTRAMAAAGDDEWAVHFGATGETPIPWWDLLECRLYQQEAYALIFSRAPPADPWEQVLRARSLAGLRQTRQALECFATAVKLSGEDPQIRSELHRARGYYFGYQDWSAAAREFSQARALASGHASLWGLEAIAQLAAGDEAAYRRICEQMLQQFGTTQNPHAANDVVFACVLAGDAVEHPERLLTVAEVAARLHPGNERVLGAVHYRLGNYAEACRYLESSAQFYRPRAWEWSFLAMAQWKSGELEKAAQSLGEAQRWIEAANRRPAQAARDLEPRWDGFVERYEFARLCGEAGWVAAAW